MTSATRSSPGRSRAVTVSTFGSRATMRLFSSRSDVTAQVDDSAWVRAMLDFEAGLAGALADVGLAPAAAAEEIASVCGEIEVGVEELGEGTARNGTPVPALLAALRERLSEDAAGELHR